MSDRNVVFAGLEDQNPPPGYTVEQLQLARRLTAEFLQLVAEHPAHVTLSALLTCYMQIASHYGRDAAVRAAETLVMTGNAFVRNGGKVNVADEDVEAIASAIAGFVASRRHGPTLDALLMVFKALAEKHECCTASAAKCATLVAESLSARAAAMGPTSSTSVH